MDEFDNEFADFDNEEEPQWRELDSSDRRELMLNIFSNPDWYEPGDLPVFEGGSANPLFSEISERSGAPIKEVKKYYAAWLKAKGFSPSEHLKPKTADYSSSYNEPTAQPAQPASGSRMSMRDFMVKDEPDDFTATPGQPSGNSEMWAMMTFLMSQQKMAMQQQQFQTMMMMEQKRDDDGRRREDRREQSARDQQFMNQNMTLLKETFKRSKDDGFFDADTKSIMKEKFVEQLMGGGDDSWKDLVKEMAGSDALKAAAGGIGTALATRRPPMPAGYDQPNYNPYAQQTLPTEAVSAPPVAAPSEPELDGVFFEGQTEAEPASEPLPQEYNRDQYAQLVFNSFVQMDPAAQDPVVRKAIQEQVDIAVDITMLELPDATPQNKIQRMSEKMLLIRNVRDIAQGLQQLSQQTPIDEEPPAYLIDAAIGQLRKDSPEFYKIFAKNTYEELLVHIEPFRDTGGVNWDYEFLLQPVTGKICRSLLNAISADAQANGFPETIGN